MLVLKLNWFVKVLYSVLLVFLYREIFFPLFFTVSFVAFGTFGVGVAFLFFGVGVAFFFFGVGVAFLFFGVGVAFFMFGVGVDSGFYVMIIGSPL